VNSGVSGPKFTKVAHDVDRTFALLTRPPAFPSCHLLWNASPKKEGVSPILPLKLAAMATSLDQSRNHTRLNIYTFMSTIGLPENLVKIGLVVFRDLFAPSDRLKGRKEEEERK